MDGWKFVAKSGWEEISFENLKTRFQDGNLSRKQESKFSGLNENNQSAKKASCLCGKIESKEANRNESKKENKPETLPAFLLTIWNERKLSVHLYG